MPRPAARTARRTVCVTRWRWCAGDAPPAGARVRSPSTTNFSKRGRARRGTPAIRMWTPRWMFVQARSPACGTRCGKWRNAKGRNGPPQAGIFMRGDAPLARPGARPSGDRHARRSPQPGARGLVASHADRVVGGLKKLLANSAVQYSLVGPRRGSHHRLTRAAARATCCAPTSEAATLWRYSSPTAREATSTRSRRTCAGRGDELLEEVGHAAHAGDSIVDDPSARDAHVREMERRVHAVEVAAAVEVQASM